MRPLGLGACSPDAEALGFAGTGKQGGKASASQYAQITLQPRQRKNSNARTGQLPEGDAGKRGKRLGGKCKEGKGVG